jgi:hypothetical protein
MKKAKEKCRMKKSKTIEKIPDSRREELDFLGQVYCPIKDRFSRAWQEFEDQYNATHEAKLRGVVPMGGCGTDIYYNITTVESCKKFPSVVTDIGYGEFFTGKFLESPEKLSWFAPPASARTGESSVQKSEPSGSPGGLHCFRSHALCAFGQPPAPQGTARSQAHCGSHPSGIFRQRGRWLCPG